MKKRNSFGTDSFQAVIELIGQQVIGVVLFLVWGGASYLIFDRFGITKAAVQVFIVIAPLVALAFWLYRTGKIKR